MRANAQTEKAGRAANGGSTIHLSAENVARLDTWLPDIVEQYRGEVFTETSPPISTST
jgi:hypothetical protein